MECGFCPHDRDPTMEDMEEVWMGYWAYLEGCWAATQRGFCGYPVNRWSIKRPPNGTKLDRWSTSGVPRPLGKTRFIPRTFNTRLRKETREVRRCMWECWIAKRTTGKKLGCMRRTHMQCNAHDDMAICNTQASDMAMTANNW